MHGTRPTCLSPRFHAACLLDEAQAECVHQLANQDADHEVRPRHCRGPDLEPPGLGIYTLNYVVNDEVLLVKTE
ncbi:hypothetical protein PG988_004624 [Apiospora saccharicola]